MARGRRAFKRRPIPARGAWSAPGGPPREELPIDRAGLLGERRRRELALRPGARGGAGALTPRIVGQQVDEPPGQGARVPEGHHVADLPFRQQEPVVGDVGRHHRHAAGQGLEDDVRRALEQRRQQRDVARAVEIGDIAAVAEEQAAFADPELVDQGVHALLVLRGTVEARPEHVADEDEAGPGQAVEDEARGREGERVVLLALEAREHADHPLVGRDTECRAQGAAVARPEAPGVDTVVDHPVEGRVVPEQLLVEGGPRARVGDDEVDHAPGEAIGRALLRLERVVGVAFRPHHRDAGQAAGETRGDVGVEEIGLHHVDPQPPQQPAQARHDGQVVLEGLLDDVDAPGSEADSVRERQVVRKGSDVDLEPRGIEVVRELDHLALGAPELEVADEEQHAHGRVVDRAV